MKVARTHTPTSTPFCSSDGPLDPPASRLPTPRVASPPLSTCSATPQEEPRSSTTVLLLTAANPVLNGAANSDPCSMLTDGAAECSSIQVGNVTTVGERLAASIGDVFGRLVSDDRGLPSNVGALLVIQTRVVDSGFASFTTDGSKPTLPSTVSRLVSRLRRSSDTPEGLLASRSHYGMISGMKSPDNISREAMGDLGAAHARTLRIALAARVSDGFCAAARAAVDS